ncbi:MAG: FG-GAP-like repeat-containing protein [Tepidisphaeraceae bacterium]
MRTLVGLQSLERRALLARPDFPGFDFYGSSYPESVAVADFDRDGHLDIVTTCYAGRYLVISKGFGDGTMVPVSTVPFGFEVRFITTADLNADGAPDLIGADATTGKVHVALNQGDGTFAAAIGLSSGDGAKFVSTADMDEDGKLDLVVANSTANTVTLFAGNGDGTFKTPTSYSVGTSKNPCAIALGDFNGDGKRDVATANEMGWDVSLLFRTATGFSAPTTLALNRRAVQIAAADFNGDGRLDLVTANTAVTTSVALFTQQSNGTFTTAKNYNTAGPTSALCIASYDVDHDGLADAVAAESGGYISVRRGRSDGTLASVVRYGTGYAPRWMALGDFNEDGAIDTVTVSYQSGAISITLGGADGSFLGNIRTDLGAKPNNIELGDFNHDNRLDVVAVSQEANRISVLLTSSAGRLGTPTSYTVGQTPIRAVARDFNHDGELDLAVANYAGKTISLFDGHADGTLTLAYTITLNASPRDMIAYDVNGDGWDDLLTTNPTPGTVSIFQNSGTASSKLTSSSFRAPTDVAAGAGLGALIAGDFTGDGAVDLVVAGYDSKSVCRLLVGTDGGFGAPIVFGIGAGGFAAGDVNRDGKLDLLTSTGSSLGVYLGLATGQYYAQIAYWTMGGGGIRLGDLNGDGILDVAMAASAFSGVHVAYGRGDGRFTARTSNGQSANLSTFAAGEFPSDVAIADITGDGRPDVVVADGGSSGTVSVMPNLAIPDTVPPYIQQGYFDTAVSAPTLALDLDEPADAFTLPDGCVIAKNLNTGEQFASRSVTIDNSGLHLVATFTPNTLSNGQYQFQLVSNTLRDLHGNKQSGALTWSNRSSYVLVGDINRDRQVNFSDLLILASNYGLSGRTNLQGNIDNSADGSVNFADLLILARAYGQALPAAPVASTIKMEDEVAAGSIGSDILMQ